MSYVGRDIAHQRLTRQQDKASLATVFMIAAFCYLIAHGVKWGAAGGFRAVVESLQLGTK